MILISYLVSSYFHPAKTIPNHKYVKQSKPLYRLRSNLVRIVILYLKACIMVSPS